MKPWDKKDKEFFIEKQSRVGTLILGIGKGGVELLDRMPGNGVQADLHLYGVRTSTEGAAEGNRFPIIQIGKRKFPLGCEGDPLKGRKALIENYEEIRKLLEPYHLIFLTGFLGRGTCSGAAPLIAEIADRELGKFTIGLFVKPDGGASKIEQYQARDAEKELNRHLNVLISAERSKETEGVFDLLRETSESIWHFNKTLAEPGVVNLDLSDIVNGLPEKCEGCLLTVSSDDDEIDAGKICRRFDGHPFGKSFSWDSADHLYVHVSGNARIGMHDTARILNHLRSRISSKAKIFWGLSIRPQEKASLTISVLAATERLSAKRVEKSSRPAAGSISSNRTSF